jgi:Uma2 family endonuclease
MHESSAPYQSILPTMYDLPSEEIGDPGLPDEFHGLQAKLLEETCRSPRYATDRLFIATDLNLYYDSRNPRRYKRPDWFLALDVPRAGVQQHLRWSYLVWQEAVSPFLVVELLSPGTEAEDLGETVRAIDQPPRKWEVYERFLRVPYYGIYDRYENQFRVFRLEGTQYQELDLPQSRLWLPELDLGFGVWRGSYEGVTGLWLRWYDGADQWIPTKAERIIQAETQAEQERQRASQAETQVEQERQQLIRTTLQPLLASRFGPLDAKLNQVIETFTHYSPETYAQCFPLLLSLSYGEMVDRFGNFPEL